MQALKSMWKLLTVNFGILEPGSWVCPMSDWKEVLAFVITCFGAENTWAERTLCEFLGV